MPQYEALQMVEAYNSILSSRVNLLQELPKRLLEMLPYKNLGPMTT